MSVPAQIRPSPGPSTLSKNTGPSKDLYKDDEEKKDIKYSFKHSFEKILTYKNAILADPDNASLHKALEEFLDSLVRLLENFCICLDSNF